MGVTFQRSILYYGLFFYLRINVHNCVVLSKRYACVYIIQEWGMLSENFGERSMSKILKSFYDLPPAEHQKMEENVKCSYCTIFL